MTIDAVGARPDGLIEKLRLLPVRHRWLRWAVLALGAAVAAGSAYLFHQQVEDEAVSDFKNTALGISHNLDSRTQAYEDVLYSMRGLFDARTQATRGEFHDFTEALSLQERYPGLANISFSILVPHAQRPAFVQAVRAENGPLTRGLPEFSIKPPGERAEYLVLHYVEPMGANVPAWGLDLYGDPMRRAAMHRARDTGKIASSTGITLLRDAKSPLTSMLLRLAVYRGKGVPDTLEKRQRLFVGVVGSTIRIEEMVLAALGKKTLAGARVVIHDAGVATADGRAPTPGALLFDSEAHHGTVPAGDYAGYQVTQYLTVGDRAWRVDVEPLSNPVSLFNRAMVAVVLSISLAAAVLLFWLMGLLSTSHSRGTALAERNRSAVLLSELGEDLYSSLTRQEAYEVLARHLPRFLPDTAGALYAFDAPRSAAAAAVLWGEPAAGIGEISTPNDCQSLRRGHLHNVTDSAQALNCRHFTAAPPRRYVCVPLSAQGELIGVLHVQRSRASSHFSDAEMYLVTIAAQHTGLALANLDLREKLQGQATRDQLTGLYNRHYVQEWFELELKRAARHKRRVGVIMVDIDHFKRINDDFGHEAGDTVLKALGALLQRSVRGSDVACRHGGEEFLLLMPESTLAGALAKAEELRREVERLQLEYHGRSIGPITISLGLAQFPEHAREAGELVRCADEALYAAKEGGRNRTVVSGGTAPAFDPAALLGAA